ncbi:Ion transport 2 domain containing protein [Aphelenchoides fujianensis]|nr:Ion transport 2 domain containing protein [Aphelenchoides fujianensis]
MLLISKLKTGLTAITPIAVHIFMILGVTVYTLFGRGGHQGVGERAHRQLRPCIQKAIRDMLALADCQPHELKTLSIQSIDDCYRYAEIDVNRSKANAQGSAVVQQGRGGGQTAGVEEEEAGWTLHNAIVFSFTIITTIGYGNVAPVTFEGRLFVIFYGILGIPLALLTIADIGLFLDEGHSEDCPVVDGGRTTSSEVEIRAEEESGICPHNLRQSNEFGPCGVPTDATPTAPFRPLGGHSKNTRRRRRMRWTLQSSQSKRPTSESVILAVLFALYLLLGSFVISIYEPEMDFFLAFYYAYISLFTIGLGDIVPKNEHYLLLTFIFVFIGLSLATIFIEIAADVLKKIHYVGRQVDATATEVWFGGKKMKLKNLIGHLGDQLNIPLDQLENFNINSFIEDAIKVADGELKTLRKKVKLSSSETPRPEGGERRGGVDQLHEPRIAPPDGRPRGREEGHEPECPLISALFAFVQINTLLFMSTLVNCCPKC